MGDVEDWIQSDEIGRMIGQCSFSLVRGVSKFPLQHKHNIPIQMIAPSCDHSLT